VFLLFFNYNGRLSYFVVRGERCNFSDDTDASYGDPDELRENESDSGIFEPTQR